MTELEPRKESKGLAKLTRSIDNENFVIKPYLFICKTVT